MVDSLAVPDPDDRIGAVFAALACPIRRTIIERLARLGPQKVTDLARPFQISKQAVTKHIRVLEAAGLLRREIRGRIHRCSLDAAPMDNAAGWIEQYRMLWESRLDALGAYLEDAQREPDSPNPEIHTET
jgi:DNA-binding transcriptional ArsR family regulator